MSILKRTIIMISISFLLIALGLQNMKFDYNKFEYESINTKNMASVKVSKKSDELDTSVLLANINSSIKENKDIEFEAVELENIYKEKKIIKYWRLPTEMGTIVQYPSYYHTAYDITSPRGYNEAIYPVYDGVISSIYYDYAGALIVTILHDEDGKKYTSQYVHLSRTNNISIGQNVTTNDIIGYMGRSGIASGVHLHITVIDCALYSDGNCPDLNGFFNYSRRRLNEGYNGLGYHINMPNSWNSR